ncbi:MAG TPA: hypothetical protein VFB67_09025 [Candidatus Polarisedimenticolaceae bacterium]|nr:hypothetical protein [Candidatus Polarisedimenticolaceae bacterium]
MSDTSVILDQTAESPTVEAHTPRRADKPIPTRRPKRFRANLRFNGLRYLTLGLALLGTWGLVRAAMWQGTGSPEGTFMLVIAGGLLAAAAKTGIDVLHWAEANRQVVHVERVHAIQRVFERARVVREQAVQDWRRIHTVLVDNLTGQPQEIRLFHDHDETDRQGERLLEKALSEEMWIGLDGVDAVGRFKKDIATLDYDGLTTEPDFLGAFNGLMDRLRRDLALAAIGIPLD